MRKQFLGHYKETDKTVGKLWDTATFVFDANVLLNLYRYSDSTRSDFLGLLKTIETRSWLPEQAAHEFLKNRTSVITDQVSSYTRALQNIDTLCNSFSGARGHPFISAGTKTKFDSAFEMINGELAKSKSKQEELIYKDDIKKQVADLFDGRVGACYTSDKLAEVFKEGAGRYDARVPPGYKDGNKIPDPKTEPEKRANFGDWIIWKQVMDHATSAKTSIIFVTDDGKEDWWEKVSGKTLGPRPELIKEFAETTNQKILIYTPDSFLNISKTQLSSKISQKSIGEVEAEHLMREKQREYKRMERHDRLRASAAVKRHERELETALFSKHNVKRTYDQNLEEFQQDDLRRLYKKRFEGNGDTGYLEKQAELSNRLDAAISHKKEIMRDAELLSTDHHHFGDAEDEEITRIQRIQRIQHHSIQQELKAISNNIDNLRAQLAYLRRNDG